MGIVFLAGCGASNATDSVQAVWEVSPLKDDPIWADPQSVKAMIISDLHYTEYKEVDPVLVPSIALAGEITDTLAAGDHGHARGRSDRPAPGCPDHDRRQH